MDAAFDIVPRDAMHKRDKRDDADKVGDEHQSVEGVGDVPCEGGCQKRAGDDEKAEEHALEFDGLES